MRYAGKRVLVTGGAGFVGSNLVRALVKEGADITVYDNLSTGSLKNLDGIPRDKYFHCTRDINYDPILPCEIIFHLAARNIIASTKNPVEDFRTNIGGTLHVLIVSRDFPVERIVYTSSASVYGNPRYLPINEDDGINLLTPYAVSKYAGEGYCMAFHESYGIPTTVLRLSNVYGRNQSPDNPYCGVVAKFMSNFRHGTRLSIHGDGLSTRDFTYVDDVVEALLLAGISPHAEGEVFNVATGIETSVLSLAETVVDIHGFTEIAYREYIDFVDRRDIDNIRRRVLNIEKIRRKLGWTPTTTLRQGLIKTKAWMNERDGLP